MAAFEFKRDHHEAEEAVAGVESVNTDPRRIREECIIALKVYDSCRHPDCK